MGPASNPALPISPPPKRPGAPLKARAAERLRRRAAVAGCLSALLRASSGDGGPTEELLGRSLIQSSLSPPLLRQSPPLLTDNLVRVIQSLALRRRSTPQPSTPLVRTSEP